jgi:predicted PolB exonuclease-like 3'-5' exonuclease
MTITRRMAMHCETSTDLRTGQSVPGAGKPASLCSQQANARSAGRKSSGSEGSDWEGKEEKRHAPQAHGILEPFSIRAQILRTSFHTRTSTMRSSYPQRPSDDHATEHVVAFDIETVVDDEPTDGSFPPWPRHKPVAAAFLTADWSPNGYSFALETLVCLPGEEAKFYEAVDRLLPKGVASISYNGRGFDLPVLQLQAMAAGRFDLEGLSTHTHAHRFGREHCDLADQFSGYGGTRRVSLVELCNALGIPAKTSVHGSDVGALWRDGDIDAITRYVREDVIATYILWLHWSAARANDESKIAVPLADLASWLERSPEFAHLSAFATCRPALWARSRALFHVVKRSLKDAELRVRKAADERAFAGERPIFFA